MCALHHTLGGVKSKGAQQLETTPNVWVEMVSCADSILCAPENPEAASPGNTADSGLSFPLLQLSAEEQIREGSDTSAVKPERGLPQHLEFPLGAVMLLGCQHMLQMTFRVATAAKERRCLKPLLHFSGFSTCT